MKNGIRSTPDPPDQEQYLRKLKSSRFGANLSTEQYIDLLACVPRKKQGQAAAYFAREGKLPLIPAADEYLSAGHEWREFKGFCVINPDPISQSLPACSWNIQLTSEESHQLRELMRSSPAGKGTISSIDPAFPRGSLHPATLAFIGPENIWINEEQEALLRSVDPWHERLQSRCIPRIAALRKKARTHVGRVVGRVKGILSLLEIYQRIYRLIDDDRAKMQAAVMGEALGNHDMKEISPEFIKKVFQGRSAALDQLDKQPI